MTEEPQDPEITEADAAEQAEPEPDFDTEQEQAAEHEDEDNAEPEQEPEQAGPTPEALAKADKRFEGAVTRYLGQVAEYQQATGQEFFRTGVDLPGMPGFIFDPRQVPLNEDQMMGARVLAGMELEPVLLPDPLSEECGTCGGEGSCATPSKVKGEKVVKCPTCEGHGFTGERLTRMLRSGVTTTMESTGASGNGALAPPPLDMFGTPLGHPGFGQNPAQWPAEWHDQLRGMGYGDSSHLNAVAS